MECRDVRDRLNEHHEGLLGEDDSREIEEHLDRCGECQSISEELKIALRVLKDLDPVEAPPWLATRIVARIEESKDERRSFLSWLFRPFSIKIPLQAVGLVFVAALAFLVYHENSDRYDVRPGIESRTKGLEKMEQSRPAIVPKTPPAGSPQQPGKREKEIEEVRPTAEDKRNDKGFIDVQPAERPTVPELEAPSAISSAPVEEPGRRKEEKASKKDERLEKMKSFDESVDSRSFRAAGAPARERMAEPSPPSAQRIAPSMGVIQTVENLLRSVGATRVEKKTEPGKTIIKASIPSDRFSHVSTVLTNQHRNARVYRSPEPAGNEAQGYETVVIEIPDP
jgi:hypothetical protein